MTEEPATESAAEARPKENSPTLVAPDSLAPTITPGETPSPAPPEASAAPEPTEPVEPAVRSSQKLKAAKPSEEERPSQKTKREEDAPKSKRSSSKIALDEDETHKAFFAGADEAVAKLHAEAKKAAQIEEAVLSKPAPPPSAAQLARRQQFRKIVGGVIGVASAFALVMMLRVASAPKQSDLARSEMPPMPKVAAPITSIPEATEKPTAIAPTPPDSAAPAASDSAAPAASDSAAPAASDSAAPAASASAAPSASASAAPSDSAAPMGSASAAPVASAAPSASAPASPEQAKTLTKKALAMLEQGSYKSAIESASASVDADPSDANAYLYWGTALMSMGKMKEAKAIFARCVETATRGPKHECKAFR